MTQARPPVDLTGRPVEPSRAAKELFAACLADAVSEPEAWTEPLPDERGDPELRRVLGDLLGHDPDALAVTAGVRAAAYALARLGKPVLVERPTFLGVPDAVELAGARPSFAAWERLADADSEAVLWVTSPVRNPDGASVGAELAERLAERARRGSQVVQNEVYRWYAPAASRVEGAVVVGSMHKLAGRQSHLGWVVGRGAAEGALRLLPSSPPRPWQRAWAGFIAAGGVDLLTEAVRAAADARAAFADALRLPSADTGPFVWLSTAPGVAEARATRTLADRGVLVGAGHDFAGDRPGCRFCFTSVTREQSLRAAEVVGEAVAEGLLRAEPGPSPR